MALRLSELATLVGGDLVGDSNPEICAASTIQVAKPGDITLVDSAEKLSLLSKSAATAVVVPAEVSPDALPAIQVADVHRAFAAIVTQFRPLRVIRRTGISPKAQLSPEARLAHDVDVHPGATIGDDVLIGAGSTIYSGARIMAGSQLGEGVTVYPNAVLYEETLVGDRSVIHAGAVIGSFGFGYKPTAKGQRLCAQLGWVEIEADVEIGSGTTIDRGTYGPTIIGQGTKIDNQVQIGHNCRIGTRNLIAAQVGIAGSTSTGPDVVIAGQAGIRDHVHIGERAVLGAMAGISNDVPAENTMLGIPATTAREQRVKQAALSRLPEMRRQFKALRKTVSQLEQQIAEISNRKLPESQEQLPQMSRKSEAA